MSGLKPVNAFKRSVINLALTQMETKIMPRIFSTYLMGFFDFKIQDFKIH